MSDKLFGLTRTEWAAQSGLNELQYSINDHAHKALFDLVGVNSDLNYMMWTYLVDVKGLSSDLALPDLLSLWDGTFVVISGSLLLLETGDFLLYENGTDRIVFE